MKDLTKLLAVIAAIVAIKRISESKKACVCAGPFCACGSR